MNNKWYKNLKDNIIGIPIKENPPLWQSSTPVPEWQLMDLGRRSPFFVNEFQDYNRDEEFAKLIKNKKIIYVGPSPHLRGKGMGSFIDSFDLVIRINQAFEIPESDCEDYGSRTDILMNCLNINKIKALGNNVEFARSLKYIVCPMVSMWDVKRVEDFLNLVGTPWHNVSDGYLFKVFKEVGTTCNTGLMGIITLLNYDIKQLHVTGMTFFNMNKFGKIYYDKYHDEAVKNNNFKNTLTKEPSLMDLRIDIHQQEPQIEYFKRMVKQHYGKILTLDEYLTINFVIGSN